MSEIIKKICVGEDTKTLVLKIHGDLGRLEIDNCGCSDKKNKDDDNCSGKTNGNSLSNANISLIGGQNRYTVLWGISPTEDGYLAGGDSGSEALVTETDRKLKFKKAIVLKNSGSIVRALYKAEGNYILGLDYNKGAGFIVWDSDYKTISSYHIYHSVQGGGDIRYFINGLYKADKDFSEEVSYLCCYDTIGYGNIVVAFDKNYKMANFVSTPGKGSVDIAISKNKVVGISSIDNKGYVFVTDSNLKVTKQVIYTTEKTTCAFKKIIKTENGYLVLGMLGSTGSKGNLLLLKLDEDLKILDKKVIECPFVFTIKSFKKKPDGSYFISGEKEASLPKVFAFLIVLDKALNIVNQLSLTGSNYDTFLDGFQEDDGTYVFAGHTKSAGYGQDGCMVTLKGDLSKLNKQKMLKYPSIYVDCDLEFKVRTDAVIEVNDKPDYKPNYEKLYSGHELKFDLIKSDGTLTSGVMIQDANMGISGS